MMDLESAIQHCEDVARQNEEDAILYSNCKKYKKNLFEIGLAENAEKKCCECANEHHQLAEWLKELKAYKEQGDDEELDFVPEHKKIPCTMIIGKSCGDAISRQAVLDLMRGLTRWCVRSEDGKFNNVGLLYDDVMFGIDKLPSVTPKQKTDTEPETGRWIDDKCSVCGKGIENLIDSPEWYKNEEPNFCPFCGIKMGVKK